MDYSTACMYYSIARYNLAATIGEREPEGENVWGAEIVQDGKMVKLVKEGVVWGATMIIMLWIVFI